MESKSFYSSCVNRKLKKYFNEISMLSYVVITKYYKSTWQTTWLTFGLAWADMRRWGMVSHFLVYREKQVKRQFVPVFNGQIPLGDKEEEVGGSDSIFTFKNIKLVTSIIKVVSNHDTTPRMFPVLF